MIVDLKASVLQVQRAAYELGYVNASPHVSETEQAYAKMNDALLKCLAAIDIDVEKELDQLSLDLTEAALMVEFPPEKLEELNDTFLELVRKRWQTS